MENRNDKEQVRELDPEQLEKASGGVSKTIHTHSAAVRVGPGMEYGSAGTLSYGTAVFFTGTVSYNDKDGMSWYQISSPLSGWVTKIDLGV